MRALELVVRNLRRPHTIVKPMPYLFRIMKDESSHKHVTIYTDGACSGNPGPGGYAAILIYGKSVKEISAGYKNTTNNRMELRGVIAALSALKGQCKVTLYTDSQYIVNAINLGWVRKWEANGWKRNKKDRALNVDLWMRVLDLLDIHQVTFVWVRGHAGNRHNERCDELAVAAAQSDVLLEDERSSANDLGLGMTMIVNRES